MGAADVDRFLPALAAAGSLAHKGVYAESLRRREIVPYQGLTLLFGAPREIMGE